MSLDEAGVPLEGLLGVLHSLVPLLLVEEAERAVRVVVRHRRVLEDGLGVAVDGRVVLPQREVLVAEVLELLIVVVLVRGRGGRGGHVAAAARRPHHSIQSYVCALKLSTTAHVGFLTFLGDFLVSLLRFGLGASFAKQTDERRSVEVVVSLADYR